MCEFENKYKYRQILHRHFKNLVLYIGRNTHLKCILSYSFHSIVLQLHRYRQYTSEHLICARINDRPGFNFGSHFEMCVLRYIKVHNFEKKSQDVRK